VLSAASPTVSKSFVSGCGGPDSVAAAAGLASAVAFGVLASLVAAVALGSAGVELFGEAALLATGSLTRGGVAGEVSPDAGLDVVARFDRVVCSLAAIVAGLAFEAVEFVAGVWFVAVGEG
jgi:hypothetical protein